MRNKDIAELFDHIADLMEFQGENRFKINAYRKGARIVKDMTEDIARYESEKDLTAIPGIGKTLAQKILEYVKTGQMVSYEELRARIPNGVIDLLRISGMGPKKAALVHQTLGIKDLTGLEQAITKGQLRDLPGMGQKSEDNILRGIQLFRQNQSRMHIGCALPLVESMIADLNSRGITQKVHIVGSLRRWKETIGDIDILVAAKNGEAVIRKFCHLPKVKNILAKGKTKGSVIVDGGIQVDLRVVPSQSEGAALQYFTGSKNHNVRVRELAKQRGYKVNEYGIFKGETRIGGRKEKEIYEMLDLPWIPPELREDRGEIEAAKENSLPNLIKEKDIISDLHVHSTWSDGASTIEEMAAKAKERGYHYVAITDHSRSLKIAHGLSIERMHEKIQNVRSINKTMKDIDVLCGAEVDILSDGSMDYPDDLLAKLDIVVASIHTGFKDSQEKIMARLFAAMDNPYVHIVGHPTGRLIHERDPYAVDIEALIVKAAKTRTILEINSQYLRLDLNDVYSRRAQEAGVKLSINTDAHHCDQMDGMRYGVGVARRAWISKKTVVNTWTWEALRTYLKDKRQ